MSIRKKPSEKIQVEFRFDKNIEDGDSIIGGTVNVYDTFGTSHNSEMVGTVYVHPLYLSAVIQGGTNNMNYILEAAATTSYGRMYEIEGILKLREMV